MSKLIVDSFDGGGGASTGRWVNGIAEWVEADTAYLSVAFTWRLDDAYQRAIWYRQMGLKVRAGGPGIFTRKHYLADVAQIGGDCPDAIWRHNPAATIASRGCPVGCWFCIVPKMEGRTFTELPDFPVCPVLCDNNLSALSPEYQDHIVGRYRATGAPLLDANSGFEPRTFDDEVWHRWRDINRGPWRFAYDDAADGPHVERVMRMLRDVSPRRKQVYTLIGNEPVDACMDRIQQVIAWGGEPYAQAFMKLNALVKRPHVRFDWTERHLKQVQRWVNGRFWKYTPFYQYDASIRSNARMEIGQLLFDDDAEVISS
ncbi:MAG: hypothetical protein P4L82_11995 [Ancalomicrobiaceae bacterium]|nr:hypothetical protein [Ancalomicrobiaceae bacterium]